MARPVKERVILTLGCLLLSPGCVSRTKHAGLVAKHEASRAALVACQSRARTQQDALAKELSQIKGEQQKALKDCEGARQQERRAATQQAQELAALEQEQARVLNHKGALKLKAKELSDSYAQLRRQARNQARRAEERDALSQKLADLVQGGALEIEASGQGTRIVLSIDPLFSLGEAQLSSTGLTQLGRVGKELRATYAPGSVHFAVQGHTDNVPKRTATIRNNWELSAARALAVVERFIESGLAPEELSAAAFGASRPRADNATREGRSANRRIVVLVSPRDPEG